MAIDPADYTVTEVEKWVTDNWHDHRNDTTVVSVHNAERDGKARVSLLDWLDHFAEDHAIDLTPAGPGTHAPDPAGPGITVSPMLVDVPNVATDFAVSSSEVTFDDTTVVIFDDSALVTTLVNPGMVNAALPSDVVVVPQTKQLWTETAGVASQAVTVNFDELDQQPLPLSDDETLIRQLKSWGLTGEPITWAEKRMQPVIFAIRAANTGFGTLATVQGLLDISYPLNDINASDVCLPVALREPTVKATKDSDGRFHLVTEDQGVDVTWFVDHGVVGHGPVHDIVLAPGRQYVIAAQVSVAGVVWTKEVTVEGAEVVSV